MNMRINEDYIDNISERDISEYANLDSCREHRLNEMARMNPPEDMLPDNIEIWVYGETEGGSNNTKEPHFHVYMNKKKVDLEIKIKHIMDLEIWRSKSGHKSWSDGLEKLKKILKNWLLRPAYDSENGTLNKEEIRREWNRCNMENRVDRSEL